MNTDKIIHIVGGGLVGSLLSLRLRQVGYRVQLFERRADVRKHVYDGGRSINLVITSRGMHGLEQAGLIKLAQDLSVPVFGRMIHSKTGDQTYQPYGQNQECNLSISRLELNKFLLNAAEKSGVEIFFSEDAQSIDLDKKILNLSSGKKASFDFVFATDGSGSALRKSFLESHTQTKSVTDWLQVDYKELTLPIPNSAKDAFLKKYRQDALHIWPRGTHMMMALANLNGSFTVTLYLPKTKGAFAFSGLTDSEKILAFFKSEFPDAIEDMPDFLNEFQKNPQGSLGTVKLSHWTDGKSIQFMGDAAHAITPFFGQGTNLGFEDVSTFMSMLEKNNFDLATTANDFSIFQKPNADAIADMAVENWFEMSEKVADPRFLLRKKAEAELERLFPQKFKSRYGMVTYTLTPYSKVYELGKEQEKFFHEFLDGVDVNVNLAQLNWDKAKAWLDSTYDFKTRSEVK